MDTTAIPAALASAQGRVDRFVREEECGLISGLSRCTRWRLERAGKFPRRRQLSPNSVGWLLSELTAWKAAPAAYSRKDDPAHEAA